MSDVLFHIIAILVAALAVVRGYRHGLTGLVTSVLGMAFGVVCAHIFCNVASEIVASLTPAGILDRSGEYFTTNLGAGLVFFIIYGIFKSVTKIINMAVGNLGSGLLNSLLGVFFCLFNYLLMLSIVYNVMVGLNPESGLMKYGKADDGNVIEAVMWIAPASLGSESFSDFAHKEQLRQAKTISENFRILNNPNCNSWGTGDVIFLTPSNDRTEKYQIRIC